jgi:ABC-type transport system involved in cytochrome bd biosynthesis fused ATPase/permease subunit
MTLTRFFVLRSIIFLAIVATIILMHLAVALADISVGQAFGTWREYIDAVMSAAILFVIGFICAAIYKYTGIKIDQGYRDSLQTALTNAGALALNKLGNDLDGKVITTTHPAIDEALNYVLKGAPDAVKRFGLTPDRLRQMIVAKIPQVANTTTSST